MKKILTLVAVFAALLVMSCGTSAADKSKIDDQGKRITTLEQTVSDLQKTVNEQKANTPASSPAPAAKPTPAPTPAPGGVTRSAPPTKTK